MFKVYCYWKNGRSFFLFWLLLLMFFGCSSWGSFHLMFAINWKVHHKFIWHSTVNIVTNMKSIKYLLHPVQMDPLHFVVVMTYLLVECRIMMATQVFKTTFLTLFFSFINSFEKIYNVFTIPWPCHCLP